MTSSKGAVLVTGAARRIGRAMVIALAEDGYDVAIHYQTSREEANATAAAARQSGVKAEICAADLLDRDAVEGLVETASSALGQPLTTLINNASIFDYDTIATATPASWDRHFKSNLEAPFFLSQSFADQLPDGKEGSIINMIDQRVRKLTPEFMSYTLAKSALWTFTQTAAQALAPQIRVNGIAPGPTMRGARQTEEHFRKQRAATLLGEGSSADGIVAAMRFILAAREVTGQLLCVDGGQHLGWKTPDIIGEE